MNRLILYFMSTHIHWVSISVSIRPIRNDVTCTYEPTGQDDDGDIFKPHNLTSFRDFVMNRTDGVGVCFTMADGVITAQLPSAPIGLTSVTITLTLVTNMNSATCIGCYFMCCLSFVSNYTLLKCKIN